ncbi:choice-of-anchor Q domain-containing protein [Marinicella sp. W31]|uniref:DUF7452 domain-containing protein n=1 Tax=Marinicella sp. W31 TaxID=3023713 RepID=UPI003756E952
MKFVFLLFLLLPIHSVFAFKTWPDTTAPCNGTLQACIDGATEGETIEIRSDSTISGNISSVQANSLIAGKGYKPVFTGDVTITSNTASFRSTFLDGLILDGGTLYFYHVGNEANIYMRNNTLRNSSNKNQLLIVAASNADLNVFVEFNHVEGENTSAPSHIIRGGLRIAQVQSSNISGDIYGNTFNLRGSRSNGVIVQASHDADVDLNITGNTFYGGVEAGLRLFRDAGTGALNANIGSNAFYDNDAFYNFSGIHARAQSGTMDLDIVNNSMIDTRWGMELVQNGGTIDAFVHNNLVAYCGRGFDFIGGVTVNNDYNLYYQNSFNSNYTPGPNAINSNPGIRSITNARLRKGSPASDAGNGFALLTLADSPNVDVDGTPRFKRSGDFGPSVVDIGAYESGDYHFMHVNLGSGSHISRINNEQLDGLSNLDSIHISHVKNAQGAGDINNNAYEAIYFASGFWRIFNENVVADILNGAAFNVSRYAAVINTFEHIVSTAGANNTVLDYSALNDQPDRILSVTQSWVGTYNPHPVGLVYLFGRWAIINLDLADMPANANFNVYYQPRSKSAWVHRATARNTVANITLLDHPEINRVGCANLQVTQSTRRGVFNDEAIGITYSGFSGRWSIYNQDGSSMPEDAEFHIIISPEQIADCQDLIFADGFY